jgi:hypothetical protein
VRRFVGAGAALMVALPLIASCAQAPRADDSFREAIPRALESAGLGLADAWADPTLSGTTETLVVGATVTALGDPGASLLDEAEPVDIDDELVRRILEVTVAEGAASFPYLRLALEDAAGDDIDVVPALARLGAEPLRNGRIDTAEAERIAEGATR